MCWFAKSVVLRAQGFESLLLRHFYIDMQLIYKKFIEYSKKISAPEFIEAFKGIQRDVHQTAKKSGWWEKERNNGEAIALMHSEISEAIEGWTKQDDKVPEFKGSEAELADCVIRIMDMAEARDWNVADYINEDQTTPMLFAMEQHGSGQHTSIYPALVNAHTSLSNALEALRKPKQDMRAEVSEALADCVAWIFMLALHIDLKVGEALCAKAEMNKTREYKHGGKAF